MTKKLSQPVNKSSAKAKAKGARKVMASCPPQIFDLGWTDPAARLSPSCGMIVA